MRASAALVASLLVLPAGAAVAPPLVAGALQPLPGEVPAFRLAANGVQVYTCQPGLTDPNAYGWQFSAPDATLYDGTEEVARWTSPNQWDALSDRSSVSAVVRTLQAAGSGDLPWALLRAAPTGESGLFAGVTSIQRVNTRGGAAPAGGCDSAHAGDEARVAFSADLYFYKRAGTG